MVKKSSAQKGKMVSEEKSINTQVKSVVPRGMIKPTRDLKFVDSTTGVGMNYDTTGSILLVNGIAEGDDFTSRNSRSVMLKSVTLRGFAQSSATGTAVHKVRTLLVWDNAANGVALAITDVLTSANSLAFPNVNNEKRFTILYDVSHVLGPFTSTATQAIADQTVVGIEALINMSAPVQFNGTGATIASIQNGSIYLITIGDSVAGATQPTGSFSTRVRFLENDSI